MLWLWEGVGVALRSACAWRQAVRDKRGAEAAQQQQLYIYTHTLTEGDCAFKTRKTNNQTSLGVNVRAMNLLDMVLFKLLMLLYCLSDTKGKWVLR